MKRPDRGTIRQIHSVTLDKSHFNGTGIHCTDLLINSANVNADRVGESEKSEQSYVAGR